MIIRESKKKHISADPGLCQGRGGAWDHRRCGTWLSGRKQRHTPSRQHLCQLHAPAIYMLLPNSYTYMPLPSVFQDVQDCRLPGLKPSKRFRRPPRQQLLQLLHAPAICFSGGSRLPFARPQTPQTLPHLPAGLQGNNSYSYMPLPSVFAGVQDCRLPALALPPNASAGLQGNNSYSYYMPLPSVFQGVQDCRLPTLPQTLPTLPQASKATTLTATCPCHLFFRGFKTAVCPPSNPPNEGVQDCCLPALKPPKRFRRPPRQQLLQLLHAPAICFSGGSRLPFALKPPKRFQPFRRPPRQQLLQLHAPAICFSGGSRLPFARPCPPPNASAGLQGNNSYSYMPLPSVFQGVQDCRLPALKPPKRFQPFRQASKATTLTATCPCHLFFRGFKTAVCPASNPPNPPNASAGLQGNNSYSYMPLPSVFQGVQDCRLPALKPPKRFQPSCRPPRQQLLQLLHAPAICFSGGSRLPFARPQTPQTLPTLPQASKATTLTATCPCHLFFRGFKTAVCPPSNPPNASNPPAGLQGNNSYSYMPLPSVFQGVQDCRLPALKPPKRFQPSRRPPRQQLLQLLHAPAICFSRGSRLPFARPQTPQTLPTLPQASKATTLTATSLPSVFQGVQDCRLPGLKPSKRFRRPPRQQLLQLLHAPAICFLGGSRLPFARPQTPQTLPTLPQASKATTLTATCPCHLFFRGFKTAVCPPSNPPNASNPPAGLQGNNSYSYMSLPFVFQGVQDCRLPALKLPKRFQPSRRPPRQQLLQLHAPAICFSGGSRLPFARPQTLQTLPQASKATTFTATCPCHLFFRGFKTAVCPASNPPNASAGLQGNNCYSYMPLLSLSLSPSLFRTPQIGGSAAPGR